MDNYSRLSSHINAYIDRKRREWGEMKADANFKVHLFACLDKWAALYNDVFLKDHRFLGIAEPFTEKTRIDPCQYYMRLDGSIVFTESCLYDDKGHLIGGYPLRFPYDPRARGKYFSDIIEPDIFGIKMKCATRVFKNGRKDFGLQNEECLRIVRYQKNGRNPILPIYFHEGDVHGEKASIFQTPAFRRDNFVVYFPFKKALHYMYDVLKFEPIVKGTNWLMNRAHQLGYGGIGKIDYANLGVTGSSSFGDTNDKEDFDVVFLDSIEKLRKVRNFLYEGVDRGVFKSVSPFRRLRVTVPEERIRCNENKPMLLCTFQMLDDVRKDPLYGAKFKILEKVDAFEAYIQDDSWNMITPPRVTVGGFHNVKARSRLPLHDGMLCITMMGTTRGYFFTGDRILAKRALLVEFTPYNGAPFNALVLTGWYDFAIRRKK